MAAQLASEAARWSAHAGEADALLEDQLGPAEPPAQDDTAGQQCVVVVDDNADMRDYLRRILAPHWRVVLAPDGERAFALLQEHKADLLLTDVMMPKLDGFALLTKIRADVALKAIPVVLVTARAGDQAVIEGLLAGADDYVAKPFSARELVARVGGQLALRRMRRRAEEQNAFLVRFSDSVRGMTDAGAVADTACRMVMEQLGAEGSYWGEIDWEAREVVVESRVVARGVADTMPGRHELDAWEPATSVLREGHTFTMNDARADPGLAASAKARLAQLDIGALVTVPVLVGGKLRAVVTVHQRSARRWAQEDIALVEGVAARCWAEVERARAEQAQRESEERLVALFTALPVGVGVLDRSGTTILSNPEWRRFLPNETVPSRDAERGWRWRIWYDDGRLTACDEFPAARALRGESVVPGLDALYTQDDGQQIWARVAAVPVKDVAGQVTGAFAVISDVDALKRTAAALSERQAQQAFLLKLSDALRPLAAPAEIKQTAARLIGEHLRVSRAFYADAEGEYWRVEAAYEHGIHPLPLGDFPMAAYGPWIIDGFRAGRQLVVSDVATDERFQPSERSALAALDIVGAAAVALVKGENLVAMLALHADVARAWTDSELELLDATAERTWSAVERARTEQALRRSEAKLALELVDAQELQRISSSLIEEGDIGALYQRIIDSARALLRSDMASIQKHIPERGQLQLLAYHGFAAESAQFWQCLELGHTSSCGIALEKAEPVLVPDVERWDIVAGTEDLAHYRRSGIRAVLSTPLVSRNGRLVGVMSTHWRDVHQPSERELRLLGVLARQAADVIEQRAAD